MVSKHWQDDDLCDLVGLNVKPASLKISKLCSKNFPVPWSQQAEI